MERLLRLAANILLLYIAGPGNISSQESRATAMASNQIAALHIRFSQPGPYGPDMILWTEPAHISVRVAIDPDPAATRVVSWPTDPAAVRDIVRLVEEARQLPASGGGEYVLEVGGTGTPVRLSWSVAKEGGILRSLRAALDDLAHLAYTEALAVLTHARNLAQRGQFREAVAAYRVGVERLGDHYLHEGLIDDTGMKQLLAESNAAEGNWQAAANVYDRVLEARLQVYAQRFGLQP
jgi:hypothetical protein